MTPAGRDERAVLEQREGWRDAFQAKDLDHILSFSVAGPQEYRGFDIYPPMSFPGGEAWRQNWQQFFQMWDGNPTHEFRDLRVQCAADLGVVHRFGRFAGRSTSGQDVDMWSRETNVLNKIDGTWLLVHDHVSVPADLDCGRACTTLTP